MTVPGSTQPGGRVVAATATGAAHLARGRPNQDRAGCLEADGWAFIAVADGHGAPAHGRSDRGARMAVDALLALFSEVARSDALRGPGAAGGGLAGFGSALVARWRSAVAGDLARDPLSDAEGADAYRVYGSTCLGAAIGPDLGLLVQIGDGDLFLGTAGGSVERPFPPARRGDGRTASLCLPAAALNVAVAVHGGRDRPGRPDFALAATDGLADSFPHEAALRGAVAGFRRAAAERGTAAVAAALPAWLAACSRAGSGDDVSVAIYAAGGAGADHRGEGRRDDR